MRRQLPVPIMQGQTSPCKDPSKDPLKLHAHVLDTPHASLRKDQQGSSCFMLQANSCKTKINVNSYKDYKLKHQGNG